MMRIACATIVTLSFLFTYASSTRAQDVSLAGTRTVYTDTEPVELAVAGEAASAVVVKHEDGSTITFQVPDAGGQKARMVTIEPATLKPGKYTATGTGAPVAFTIAPAEHKNPYPVGQWVHHGGTVDNAIAKGGWMYMTTDYVSMHPRKPAPNDIAEGYIVSSMRPYALMVCGGGHQLDLQLENDWGDPWVQRAVMWRVQLAGLSDRIYPIAGLHLYDEPGLTWWPIPGPDGKPKESNPFCIPHQLEEFKKLTGKDLPVGLMEETTPKYKPILNDWLAFMDMRMKYLEQCWNGSVWAAQSVHPTFGMLNQVSSSYAPHDITDGVDSRQNRPYEFVSGHGQYSDLPFGTMQPVRGFESYQGFGWDRKHIYVPMWYTHTWATVRNGIWMSWIGKSEGMMYSPEQCFAMDNRQNGYWGSRAILEMAETNHRMAKVGGVMNDLPKSLAPVAILQSHTQASWDIAEQNFPEPTKAGIPAYVSPHREAVNSTFFRIMETGMIPNTVDEIEAVEKGAEFLGQWKVVFCPGLMYATPAFTKVLEEYVAGGGTLIQAKGDKLIIKGSIVADHTFGNSYDYYMKNVKGNSDKAAEAKKGNDAAGEAAATALAIKAGTDLAYRKFNNEGAPTFAKELAGWVGELPYSSSNPEVFLVPHKLKDATFLLIANNAQSADNPRTMKHELIPAETTIKLPAGGVMYDLFNGGEVKVGNGQVPLKLAGGDGACWVHLPAAPDDIHISTEVEQEDAALVVSIAFGGTGSLPFRLRILDPSGNVAVDYYRATKEGFYSATIPLGANAAKGNWTVQADEWLTGKNAAVEFELGASSDEEEDGDSGGARLATVETDNVSIYFDDAQRIIDLITGKMQEPDYAKLNWDAKRVLGLNAEKFAVFAKEPAVAEKVAEALRGRGLTAVEVNPKYEIVPFKREPGRGGAGPIHGANFENIYAHTIVIAPHPLAEMSFNRGHINRPVTANFPGPGRAFVQWGTSCYQMGWQNIFVFGDTNAGVEWLVDTIKDSGTPLAGSIPITAKVAPAAPKAAAVAKLEAGPSIKTYDSIVAVDSSPDGQTTYVALYDGSVSAYDATGKQIWTTPVLLEGTAMRVNSNGDRIAVAGYPGIQVLDAKTGKVLGGFKAAPMAVGNSILANRIVDVAWNTAGTRVAAGWSNNVTVAGPRDVQDVVILDADGKVTPVKGVEGNVMGLAFVPNSDTLIVGSTKLTAVNTANGQVLWSNPDLNGAQSFSFSADNATLAAGGWDRKIAAINLADGKTVGKAVELPAVVGGVVLTPAKDIVAAVWGGTNPLMVLKSGAEKPEPLFKSRFGFQDVAWSAKSNALIAAEQGGKVWVLGVDGQPKATLDEEAGTTVYDLRVTDNGLLLGRMNRVAQRVAMP